MSELQVKVGGMGVEPHVDREVVLLADEWETSPSPQTPARRRPNVSGDLPSVFETAPMFRRAIAGYDRFQVDSYVQWAEEELATGDRERAHLTDRYLRTEAALTEARELLSHSSGGAEFLQLSRRIGTLLAGAADEADGIRAEAQADRSAAAAELEQAAAEARRLAAEAQTRAEQTVATAASEAAGMLAEAHRLLTEAEETRTLAGAEAAEARVRMQEQERAAADAAARMIAQAADEAAAARLNGRDEVVAMLTNARAERRRADEDAAELRERLDRAAEDRRTALLAHASTLRAEVESLERRRVDLHAETQALAEALADARDGQTRGPRRFAAPRLGALRRIH